MRAITQQTPSQENTYVIRPYWLWQVLDPTIFGLSLGLFFVVSMLVSALLQSSYETAFAFGVFLLVPLYFLGLRWRYWRHNRLIVNAEEGTVTDESLENWQNLLAKPSQRTPPRKGKSTCDVSFPWVLWGALFAVGRLIITNIDESTIDLNGVKHPDLVRDLLGALDEGEPVGALAELYATWREKPTPLGRPLLWLWRHRPGRRSGVGKAREIVVAPDEAPIAPLRTEDGVALTVESTDDRSLPPRGAQARRVCAFPNCVVVLDGTRKVNDEASPPTFPAVNVSWGNWHCVALFHDVSEQKRVLEWGRRGVSLFLRQLKMPWPEEMMRETQ